MGHKSDTQRDTNSDAKSTIYHSFGSKSEGFDYGSGFPLADLQSLINQVQFEGVNLPSL